MTSRRVRISLCVLMISVLTSAMLADAWGQDATKQQFSGSIETRYRRARSGAPIPIVWKLEWNGRAIAKGAFEYEILDGNQLLAAVRVPEVVLSPGRNEFNATIPALNASSSSSVLTIQGRFIADGHTFGLDELTIRAPTRFVQWFNVGIVTGMVTDASPEVSALLERVRMEVFAGLANNSDPSTTTPFELRSNLLPNDPLTLCNFDVLALTPIALSELRDDQAAALRKWVVAGGSLCVFAGGGLNAKHALFLNELFAEAPGHEAFVIDARGFLGAVARSSGRIHSARKGLGRVVLLDEPSIKAISPSSDPWRSAAGFLLKIRSDRIHSPAPDAMNETRRSATGPKGGMRLAPGQAAKPLTQQQQWEQQRLWQQKWRRNQMYESGIFIRSALAVAPPATLDGLFQLLMPANVKMVPLGVIATILTAYVIAIGPVDYYLLGLLRLRRFTWILFPVVTAGFAAFTLWLSQWYLGTNDHRRGIEVYDVVQGGVAARRTRVELLFLSGQRDVATEVHNGLFSHLGLGVRRNSAAGKFGPAPGDSLVNAPLFIDRFPSRYVVGQSIPQWTPVVNRFSWIDPKLAAPKPEPAVHAAGAVPDAGFDWDHLEDLSTSSGRSALVDRIRKSFGVKACATIYSGAETILLQGALNSLRPPRLDVEPGAQLASASEVIHELSVRNPEHLFAIASQVSPNGGPDLEDLALLDASDPRQSLLVIVVDKGEDLVMYRRLFVGDR